MKQSLTDLLCTRCGLCCGGALFADVELAPSDDPAALEILGLEIEDDEERRGGELLLQPCGALRGTRCGIYPQRPECCRTFECRVLKQVRLGQLELPQALDLIAGALNQLKKIERSIATLGQVPKGLSIIDRCQEVLELTDSSRDPATLRAREELEKRMTSLTRYLQTTFLGRI